MKGVTQVTSGYSGGSADTAQYETVSSGMTGHAESVRVVYDVGGRHDKPGKGSRAVAESLRTGGIDANAYALPDSLGPGGDVDEYVHQRRPGGEQDAEKRQEPAAEGSIDVVRESPQQEDGEPR